MGRQESTTGAKGQATRQGYNPVTNRLGPYELNTIVAGECSALMAALPDGCIDFWLTSPPYDGQRTYHGYTFDFERIAAQLYRVTKPGGVGVWVVADETKDGSESGTSFRQALGFMAVGFNLHDTMIYQTDKPPMNDRRYQACFEFMFIFSKGNPKIFNPITEISKHAGKIISASSKYREVNGKQKPRFDFGGTKATKVKNSIWYYPTNSTTSCPDHPAPFPEALARDHILSWSSPGDILFDPMAGSGTSCKMAHLLGRHYLGFDISAEYCELARRRLAGVEAQPFLMPPSVEANSKPEQASMDLAA